MKSALLSPVGLVAAIISAVFIVWPLTRFGAGFWEPFVPETLSVDLWVPPGAKVLNEPGPVKITEVRIQAPTVIRLKDRETFAVLSKRADRVEVTFTAGARPNSNGGSENCVHVGYTAHGKETTYLLGETLPTPTGQDWRGTLTDANFSLSPPRTLLWQTEEPEVETLAAASAALGLVAIVASFVTFLLVWGAWTAVQAAAEAYARHRKPPVAA